MSFFGKKETKTVKSVYETFTSELKEVQNQQVEVMQEANLTKKNLEEERQRLNSRIDQADTRKAVALGEIEQAKTAMDKIGEMLGIQSKG